jgi:class 3 adenylate cyclase
MWWGYSRLMGADEEGTLERLKALRRELLDPKVAEHHGAHREKQRRWPTQGRNAGGVSQRASRRPQLIAARAVGVKLVLNEG